MYNILRSTFKDINIIKYKMEGLKKDKLKSECKIRQLKVSGTKTELINRITEWDNNNCNKILFIDVETTGLPKTRGFLNYYEPEKTEYYDNSRMIEIGYIICDDDGNISKKRKRLIKPDQFIILNSYIHGITTEKANNEGVMLSESLELLRKDLISVSTIVAHNVLFDINILLSECYRNKNHELIKNIRNKKLVCTMNLGNNILRLNKMPKLSDLYKSLCGKDIVQKHRALYDAKICRRCYYKLKNYSQDDNKISINKSNETDTKIVKTNTENKISDK
jgi:DNA polymerase III subunit epsilon